MVIQRMYTLLFCLIVIVPCKEGIAKESQNDLSSQSGMASQVKLDVLDIQITAKRLDLTYRIKNESTQDIWVMIGHNLRYLEKVFNLDTFIAEDNHTLVLRKLLNIPLPKWSRPEIRLYGGRYVRLRPGETQTEGVLINLPIRTVSVFDSPSRQKKEGVVTHLKIQLGYHIGDLPKLIKEYENDGEITTADFEDGYNKEMSQYDEVLLCFPERGEQVLEKTVEGLRIPYGDVWRRGETASYEPPNLSKSTKITLSFYPSMLEYFYPYQGQQNLISKEEKSYLDKENGIVITNPEQVRAITSDIHESKGVDTQSIVEYEGVVRYRTRLDLNCYQSDSTKITLPIYNGNVLLTEKSMYFCRHGMQSLKQIIPHVQQIDDRLKCAGNLITLWNRLRLYPLKQALASKIPSLRKKEYPDPGEWCDVLLTPITAEAVPGALTLVEWNPNDYICPSGELGKCHYAINPNCKYDSSPDTILLFETSPGWNQSGGPEQFSIANHDPAGGCVVYNDGSVEFLRTKEEIKEKKWK